VVIGYAAYFDLVGGLVANKEHIALALGEERTRARLAVERCLLGQSVCVISSGDAGIYGMAGLVLEAAEAARSGGSNIDVTVVPGVSAVNACASLLGAPLGHDFAVISLSDLWTPWPAIEKRLEAAASADFVIALLNPRSLRRDWQLGRACEILLEHRLPATPAGIVRHAFRDGQEVEVVPLSELAAARVDMFTTVIVGNAQTRQLGVGLVTPRGIGEEHAARG
jgi:precorrin-3B C17-methyltransferase